MEQPGKMWDVKSLVIWTLSWLLLKTALVANRWRTRRQHGIAKGSVVLGFFHPFCAGGGGGERVLWRAVHALARLSREEGDHGGTQPQRRQSPPLHVLIYTGDVGFSPEQILSGVSRQFQISVGQSVPVGFVYLRGRWLLDPARYPVLTMLGQSVGSMILAVEALFRSTPDVFIDTTGFAFSFPVAWLAGCTVGAYVHYPTISTDMLSRVREQRPSYNNSSWISSSVAVSRAKLLYYQVFAILYGIAGSFASAVMVNSSWTRRHVAAMWKLSSPVVVFPPCDTTELEKLPINDGGRDRCVLSVGQFRPEKDHALQIRALSALQKLSHTPQTTSPHNDAVVSRMYPSFDDVRLVILGSCRNEDDRRVLARTKALAAGVGVENRVEFVENCNFRELKARLGRASVGLHTMWNEHFGIGVVEMMASGLVTIAHRSGGPEADIIVPLRNGQTTGFLAETPEEYARAMAQVFADVYRNAGDLKSGGGVSKSGMIGGRNEGVGAPSLSTLEIRVAGRETARRFSHEVFDDEFSACVARLLRRTGSSWTSTLADQKCKQG